MGRQRDTQLSRRIGSRIRDRRVARGLSQTQLASAVGLTLQQIQKYETAKSRIPVDRLASIADHLGTSVGYFADAADETHPADDASVSRQSMDLVRHFQRIQNPAVRNAVLSLLRRVAEGSTDGLGSVAAPSDSLAEAANESEAANPSSTAA